jgi:hypothetical protein
MTPRRGRIASNRGALLLIGFGLALVVAVAIPLVSMGRMMAGPPPATMGDLAGATPGARLEVALELSGPPADGLVTGAVLERVDAGMYRRTTQQLRAHLAADTPVLMGRPEDVRGGAVVQIRGQLTPTHELAADRVVILTGAVRVQ